jgi:transcriptional regulator with XRE-family HTH domain
MARAHLRNAETADFREHIGRIVRRARALVGWSLKEFAAHVGRDERQVSRWESGQERAQFDALMAVEALRGPLVQALAEGATETGEVEVICEIRIRRLA